MSKVIEVAYNDLFKVVEVSGLNFAIFLHLILNSQSFKRYQFILKKNSASSLVWFQCICYETECLEIRKDSAEGEGEFVQVCKLWFVENYKLFICKEGRMASMYSAVLQAPTSISSCDRESNALLWCTPPFSCQPVLSMHPQLAKLLSFAVLCCHDSKNTLRIPSVQQYNTCCCFTVICISFETLNLYLILYPFCRKSPF